MTKDDCTNMEFLLQAGHDGELEISATATLAAHLAHCPACQARQAALAQLSTRLRTELPYHAAPDRLRAAIAAAAKPTSTRAPWRQRALSWAAPFGGGAALAFAVAVLTLMPRTPDIADSVVASHIRALQPGHLTDVVSTDEHTVKPWFDGKLDYAPPVKDLAAQGFPLIGGRLDYLSGRPVAALAYQAGKHEVDLYVWPHGQGADAGDGEHSGYNYVGWSGDGMELWAVSDLNPTELREFERRWRAAK